MAVQRPFLFCPHCDSPHVKVVPPANPDSQMVWYRFEACGRMFGQTVIIAARPH